MKDENTMTLRFGAGKEKSYLWRVDQQFLKELENQQEMIIEGESTSQAIITSSTSCFRIKQIHISNSLLITAEDGTIVQQKSGYLDIQKFIPYFHEVYHKIASISFKGDTIHQLNADTLISQFGFTKDSVKKYCYLSEQEFFQIGKAMGFVKIVREDQVDIYLYISAAFGLAIMRQLIKIHNEIQKNLLKAFPVSEILQNIPTLTPQILQSLSTTYQATITSNPSPCLTLTRKSILIYILSEMASAKKHYSAHTFDEVLDEMLMMYVPIEAQFSVAAMKQIMDVEMRELYETRFLFFVQDKMEKFHVYDFLDLETDVTSRLRFLSQFKNRWKLAELKAIFRGVDSTEGGKFISLGDLLLKKFRKYGEEYEIKFILPAK